MAKSKNTWDLNAILEIAVAVLAIMSIKSLFQNDSASIVTKRGKNVLNDDVAMKDIEQQIQKNKGLKHNELSKEIVIDLDKSTKMKN